MSGPETRQHRPTMPDSLLARKGGLLARRRLSVLACVWFGGCCIRILHTGSEQRSPICRRSDDNYREHADMMRCLRMTRRRLHRSRSRCMTREDATGCRRYGINCHRWRTNVREGTVTGVQNRGSNQWTRCADFTTDDEIGDYCTIAFELGRCLLLVGERHSVENATALSGLEKGSAHARVQELLGDATCCHDSGQCDR